MGNTSGSGVFAAVVFLASLAWLATVAYFAWQGWPTVPLDMSPNDAATRAAHDNAATAYLIRNALLGLVPVLLGWTLVRLVTRRR